MGIGKARVYNDCYVALKESIHYSIQYRKHAGCKSERIRLMEIPKTVQPLKLKHMFNLNSKL